MVVLIGLSFQWFNIKKVNIKKCYFLNKNKWANNLIFLKKFGSYESITMNKTWKR
jgi:hypothetical protein